MYDYIKGKIESISPTEIILECGNIGYIILISLQTFEAIKNLSETKIYLYHHLREDEEQFYGFYSKDERELFKLLISVSGIGASSARMMLSSLSGDEIRNAILTENIHTLKSIKGIGLKTAQRIVLELKDKIVKGEGTENKPLTGMANNAVIEEASTALTMLGFAKASVNKVLAEITKDNSALKVEDIIKAALQRL